MNPNPHTGYKLLTQNMTSHGGMKWEIGKLETAKEEGTEMCSPQVLHYYSHPLVAIFANTIHANIEDPRLFEIEVEACVSADSLKCASKTQRLVKELAVPQLNNLQRKFVAISCAKLLPGAHPVWTSWAEKWLSGEDRTSWAEERARAYAYARARDCACARAYAYAHACAHDCACTRAPTAQIITFLEASLTNPTLQLP